MGTSAPASSTTGNGARYVVTPYARAVHAADVTSTYPALLGHSISQVFRVL